MPAWRDSLTTAKDTWVDTGCLSFTGAGATSEEAGSIGTWCGAATDNAGKMWVGIGGGHSAFGQPNTMWCLDATQNARPTWTRIHPGSDPRDYRSEHAYYGTTYSPKLPGVRHNYFNINYVPAGGVLDAPRIMFGPHGAMGGQINAPDEDGLGSHVDGYNITTNTWDIPYTYPQPAGESNPFSDWGGCVTVLPNGNMWCFTSFNYGYFYVWSRATNTWSTVPPVSGVAALAYRDPMVLDVGRDRLIGPVNQAAGGNYATEFTKDFNYVSGLIADQATVTGARVTSNGWPSGAGYNSELSQIVHDTINDRYLWATLWWWDPVPWNWSRSSLFSIDPVTWECTYLNELPWEGWWYQANGIMTRLVFDASLGGLLFIPNQYSPVYFMPVTGATTGTTTAFPGGVSSASQIGSLLVAEPATIGGGLIFDSALEDEARGHINFATGTFKVMLTSAAYVASADTHTRRADVTNEVTGTNWPAGGVSIVPTVTLDSASGYLDVVFPALTVNNATFTGARRAIYYQAHGGASSADELVAINDFEFDASPSNSAFQLGALTYRTTESPTGCMYYSALADEANGNLDYDTHTFKVMLVGGTYIPARTHSKRSDVTAYEITGTNWPAGGVTVVPTVTLEGLVDRVSVDFAFTTVANVTAGGVTYAVYYRARGGAASADELVAFVDLAGPLFLTNQSMYVRGFTYQRTIGSGSVVSTSASVTGVSGHGAVSAPTVPQIQIVPTNDRVNIAYGLTNWQSAWFVNGTNYAPWVNPGGDWIDRNGTLQGSVPYASTALAPSGIGTVDISSIDGDIILFGINIFSYVKIDGVVANGWWVTPASAYSSPFPSHYLSQIFVENDATRGTTLEFDYYSTDGTVRAFKVQGPAVTDYPDYVGTPTTPDIWQLEPTSDADITAAAALSWGGPGGRIDSPIANGGTEYGTDPATGLQYVRMAFYPAYNVPLPQGGNRCCSWRLPYGEYREEVYTRWCVYMEDDVALGITDGVKMMGPIYNETMESAPDYEMIAFRINNGEPSRTNPGLYPLYKYLYDAEEGTNSVPFGVPMNAFVRTNKWYCLELGIRLNTPGVSDGYAEFRVNGHPTWTSNTMRFRNAAATRVSQFFVNLYHGGHGQVLSPMHYRFAKFAASSTWCGVPAELFATYPAWRQTNLVKDTWEDVSADTYVDGIARAGQPGLTANQVNNWCGSPSGDNRIFFSAGGGHPPTGNPYNSTWCLDLDDDDPLWAMLNVGSDPRDYNEDQSVGGYNRGDYGPVIRQCIHTYHTAQFRKGVVNSNMAVADGGADDRLFFIDSSPWGVDGFNIVTNLWDPPWTWPNPSLANDAAGGLHQSYQPTCQDPRDGKIWIWGGPYDGRLQVYDPGTNAWGSYIYPDGVGMYSWWWHATCIDTVRNRWLILQAISSNVSFSFYTMDITTHVATGPHVVTIPSEVTDTMYWASTSYNQLIYDPFNDRYLFAFKWVAVGDPDPGGNATNQSLMAIDPETWASTFVNHLPHASSAAYPGAWGIFNRLALNEDMKCLTWVSQQWSPAAYMPLVSE